MKIHDGIAAVVTGGASGLGYATAVMLAEAGAKVTIFDINEAQAEKVAKELGGHFCVVDVTSEEQVDAGFASAREKHGQERILVNCAGTGGKPAKTASRHRETGDIKRFPTAGFDFVVQLNLVGSFRCASAAAAGMLTLDPGEDGERGTIVNTASIAAEDGQMGQAAYAASKAGICGMTLAIARDLAGEGVRVNTIMPGIFETPMMAAAPQNVLDALGASVPFPQRLGAPPEYASLVRELVENVYFNGQSIRLDGALRMAAK